MDDFAVTLLYKRILPDVETFRARCQEYAPEVLNFAGGEFPRIVRILYHTYCNSNIRYDSADAFCRHFFMTFEDEYQRYKKRLEVIQHLYGISTDELTTISTLINSRAERPNEEVPDPLDTVIPFISVQVASKSRTSKIDAYLRALDDYTNNYIRDFADKFRDHFITVLPTGGNIF